MEEKFLPIGSVVLLKGGERELMITSYCVAPKGEVIVKGESTIPQEGTIYEYGACLYPDGVIDPNMICSFNSEDIEKVVFRGYETDQYKEYVDVLQGGLKRYREKISNKEQ